MNNTNSDLELAPTITKAASRQTYYTIRFLVDPERMADAYRAYAYFRWVDDSLDAETGTKSERIAFIGRQKILLEGCYLGKSPQNVSMEERMLVELIHRDRMPNSGLQIYLRNMMQVMAFDAERRDRLISASELIAYTRLLSSAVTEAMHYFIGHSCYSPHNEARYLAVAGAHIIHMLRDTFDDIRAGYYNIPYEVLDANHISFEDVHSDAYRAWVRERVQMARAYFKAGRDYLGQVENPRCRLAGFAYMARFEWLLDTIEIENYYLRPQYEERKSPGIGLRMGWSALSAMSHTRGSGVLSKRFSTHQQLMRKP